MNAVDLNPQAGRPGGDLISGSITYGREFKLTLEDQPYGYAAVDFVKEGYKAEDFSKKNWQLIGIIKSERSYLYKLPSHERTKVYVVSEDVVKIIEKMQGWLKIEYNPPENPGKTFTGWIPGTDLYDLNPDKW